MPPRRIVLTSFLLILGLLLSGMAVHVPAVTGNGDAPGVVAGVAVPAKADQPDKGNTRQDAKGKDHKGKSKGKNKGNGKGKGKHERWHNGPKKGERSHSGDRPANDTTPRDASPCVTIMELPGDDLCTHGPDPAPPGFDEERPVAALSPSEARQEVAAIACEGDGQSGYRTQVLYVHTGAGRYAQMLPSIQAWAGEADQILRNSAAETGGVRAIRFVHDASCLPTVPDIMLSSGAMGNFSTMTSELRAAGYGRTDRLYMIFADATTYCGIGSFKNNDAVAVTNSNNTGPGYARVDSGCWGGSTAAHELMHNLGGVQNSAPNGSGGAHCVDEYDVMCYSDSPNFPTMRIVCSDRTPRMDCNHDDYFHTNPAPGSYLATHWNTANNRFLIGGSDGPTPPPPTPTPTPRPPTPTPTPRPPTPTSTPRPPTPTSTPRPPTATPRPTRTPTPRPPTRTPTPGARTPVPVSAPPAPAVDDTDPTTGNDKHDKKDKQHKGKKGKGNGKGNHRNRH